MAVVLSWIDRADAQREAVWDIMPAMRDLVQELQSPQDFHAERAAEAGNLAADSSQPEDAKFLVPDGVYEHFAAGIGARGADARRQWTELFAAYRAKHPNCATEIEQMQRRELPAGWDRDLPVFLSAGAGPGPVQPDGTVAVNDAWVDAKGSFLAAVGATRLCRPSKLTNHTTPFSSRTVNPGATPAPLPRITVHFPGAGPSSVSGPRVISSVDSGFA